MPIFALSTLFILLASKISNNADTSSINDLENKGFIRAQWIKKSEFNEPKCISKINIRQGKNEYDVGSGRNTPILITQDCNSEVWVLPKSETIVYYTDGNEAVWIRVVTKHNDKYVEGWVNRSFLTY